MSDKELSKEEIKKLIGHEAPFILDIGTYDGRDAFALQKIFKGGMIVCFEADPRSAELFRIRYDQMLRGMLSFDHSPEMILVETAVGSIDGTVMLYQSDSETRRHHVDQKSWSASSSLSKPKKHLELFPDVQFNASVNVDCIRLDSFYKRCCQKSELIDFVWCDVNGAEKDVLLGGLCTLNNYTRYLYIEFSNKELYEGQVSKEELLKLLPNFEELGVYNFQGNFGNVLLKNKTL